MSLDSNERRLRPIYDALDNEEYKKALKLIQSQLGKKQSSISTQSQILRALKAFALDRTKNSHEAIQVVNYRLFIIPQSTLSFS